MAYLTGSRALEIVGHLSKPAADYDIVVSRDELAFLANRLKGTDFVLGKHQTYPGKYYLLTDAMVGELTIDDYASHELVKSRIASFCNQSVSILGLDVHVASLATLWVYKRGPATYPINNRKTLADLVDLSAQLFGPGQPADYEALNADQMALLDMLKSETRSRVEPDRRRRPEPDDVEDFFALSVAERVALVRRIAPNLDALHLLLNDLTGTTTAAFILDHIGPASHPA